MSKEQKDIINKSAIHPLQSWEWGEFRRAWGNEIVETKYGLLTLHKIFTSPKLGEGGPLLPNKVGMFIKGPLPTAKMLTDLKDIGRKYNLIFIKLEPNAAVEFPISNFQFPIKSESTNPNFETKYSKGGLIKLLKDAGAVPGKTLFTPTTFWIDLTRPEEEILKSFHPKTRYNIRVAQKNGVTVEEDPTPPIRLRSGLRGAGNSGKAFEIYLELMRETVERQGFYAHSEKYHRLMWKHLHKLPITPSASLRAGNSQLPIARLLTAKYKGEIITTWIVFVYKDFLYYPYGASSEKYKNVMANNLMMWEAIKFGKKMGLKTFDLWGREEGKGFTKFKEGYNPKVVEFLGTWDLVINKPLYFLYRLAEKIRWPILRFKSKITKPKF